MTLFQQFVRYYRPYRWIFAADMVCVIVAAAVDLAFPQLLNLLTRDLFCREPRVIIAAIGWVGGGLLALYAVRFAAEYFTICWGHIMGARMETDMRRDLFTHYQRLSFSYFDRNNTGEMMSRMVADLFDITELSHHGPETVLVSVLKIIGSFVILLTVNVPMTLVLLAVTLVMVVFSVVQNLHMRAVFTDNRRKIAGVNAGIQDSLAGIRVVKSFTNEAVERGKFDDRNHAYLRSKVESYRVMGRFHAWNVFLQGLLYTVILVSGGVCIAHGTLTPTELAVYALYIGIFLHPLNMLLHFAELFQRGVSGFRRFSEIIATMPEISDAPDAVAVPSPLRGEVAYRGVDFSYDSTLPVLKNINLNIPPGRTLALVGVSGGGKSTICSLLPRFYDVKSGSVTLDGVDVRHLRQHDLRGAIGIVQQDVYIFAGTLRDNIAYGRPGATGDEIVVAAKRANIHDFIMSLPDGYDALTGERGVRLSGGQKQRISIARVFLKNPPVLILDEATSALDNESERKIQSALAELSAGRTTLVIAHRLSTIRNADSIAVIEHGEVVELGSHDELMAKDGRYAYYRRLAEGV